MPPVSMKKLGRDKPNFCSKDQNAYLKDLNNQGITHTEGLSEEKVREIRRELSARGEANFECESSAAVNPLLTCTPGQERAIDNLHQVLTGEHRPITQEEYNSLNHALTREALYGAKKTCQPTQNAKEQLDVMDRPPAMRFLSVPIDRKRAGQVNIGRLPTGHWETDLATLPGTAPKKIANIDLQNAKQQNSAAALTELLTELRFDQLAKVVHPEIYGKKTLFDYDGQLSFTELEARLERLPEFSEREKLALLFFKYGKALTHSQLQNVFGKNAKDLISKLTKLGILTICDKNGTTVYRLNDFSILSHTLPNGKTVYLLHDLPRNYLRLDGEEPTAQVSSTSYELLNRVLEEKYVSKDKFHGRLADFGSGVGIQGISLALQYPNIESVMAVEIDPHAMNLSRFNAMMNGLADRFTVVDNQDALEWPNSNFETALAGAKIDVVVTNLPFNVVPSEFRDQFTSFGYGGDYGIDVAKIFWRQALPNLKEGAPFISYGYLATDVNNEAFASKELKRIFIKNRRPLHVSHIQIGHGFYGNNGGREAYAHIFVGYIRDHITGPEAEAWFATDNKTPRFHQALKNSGIENINPYFTVITPKTKGGFEVEEMEDIPSPF